MPLHIGPRLHAFAHGLLRQSDEGEAWALNRRVRRLFREHDLLGEGRDRLIVSVTVGVLDAFGLDAEHPQAERIAILVSRLFNYEELFQLPDIDWCTSRTVAQWWEVRDALQIQLALVRDFPGTRERIERAVVRFLSPISRVCPALLAEDVSGTDVRIATDLAATLSRVGTVTERAGAAFFDEEIIHTGLFSRLRDRLERNLIAASGGNPANPEGFSRALKRASRSDLRDPAELLSTYFGDTPLVDYFAQQVDFTLPTDTRFEHHHIVAGSGHGKTQTLQYLVGADLAAVAEGTRSVIVLDSQGDLIETIAGLSQFAPGGALHDRIVLIDPSDVEYPVSLNLFDAGLGRLTGYEPLERERLTNSILELYDFVLGSLLAAEMTQKQNVVFRYVTRLMLVIPHATIHTLRELMEPDSHATFADDIARLTGSARHFFETEFSSKEFDQTKKQILRRLWGILENQTFDRMFSSPRSKLDMFSEMNAGKVILINTAKDLLKEQGTEIFGRFFIALIAQAAQERATLPERERLPTFVYIDEAADYFDRNISVILAQARKYKVGMVLAHQYLGQLEPRLQDAFAANTAIKFAGGVSAKDARTLAPMLSCDPEFIARQRKGSFAAHLRGMTGTAVPLRFPLGSLEAQQRMTQRERDDLRDVMRMRYAEHYCVIERQTRAPENPAPPVSDTPKRTQERDSGTDNTPRPGRRTRRRRRSQTGERETSAPQSADRQAETGGAGERYPDDNESDTEAGYEL